MILQQPGASTGNGAAEKAMPAEYDLRAAQVEIARLRAALQLAQDRERALSFELQHRLRNTIAVIRTIYRRSRESGASHELFAEHFEGRLGAVARYQSEVDAGGPGLELEDMVRNELLASHYLDGPGCTISGPPVALRHKTAELFGLALHELATNSLKFGALAQGGRLTIAWTVSADG